MDIDKELEIASELIQQDNIKKAEQILKKIISLQPDNLEALYFLAEISYRVSDFDSSIDYLRRAINYNPDNAEAYNNLGLVLQEKGKIDEAIGCYRRAIFLNPSLPNAYYNLGNMCKERNQPDEAVNYYRKAIELDPELFDAYINLGKALQDAERYDEAIGWYQTSQKKYPENADLYNNLGISFQKKGLFDEAISCYQKAIRLNPACHDVYNNLGFAFEETGRVDEAISLYRKAIRLENSYANAHWNLARALLLAGNYEEGWREYEWRWKADTLIVASRHSFPHSQFMLEKLSGQTVLLHAEQGFGDNIQFIRYAPLLAERGAKVIVECYRELMPLFRSVEGIDQLILFDEQPPPFDQHCQLLRLPLIFNTNLENIPANIPYLVADRSKSQKWRERILRDDSHLKIGLVWAGNPKVPYKHLSLGSFAPLAELRGISFYSLQKGEASAHAKNPPAGMELVDCSPEIHDFSDTAAIMENLDLVISIDTAVAHLAGAMGLPVWTLIRFIPDWRWLLNREDSPWYPTMRLFRQPAIGDWEAVIKRICEQLQNLKRSREEDNTG